jgi:GST-like protein
MYTLFGFQGSGSAAIEMAFELAELPLKIIEAASWEEGSSIEQLGTLNPLKQIPTLVLPEGGILTESAAILIELGLRYPASGLLPADAAGRSQAIRGLIFIAANCYSAIGIIDYPERWLIEGSDPVREAVRDGARHRLHKNWEIFADSFALTDVISGEVPTALDSLAVVVSQWSGSRAHLRAARPSFLASLERLELHEKLAPICQRHWPA